MVDATVRRHGPAALLRGIHGCFSQTQAGFAQGASSSPKMGEGELKKRETVRWQIARK